MHRRTARISAVTAGVLVVAACAGQVAVSDWLRGDWQCTVTGSGSTTASVELGDGTWRATVAGSGSYSESGTYEGTWALGAGTLAVTSEKGWSGSVSGVPETTDELGAASGAGLWGSDEGSISVRAGTDSISVLYTDPFSENVTTTVCTKG